MQHVSLYIKINPHRRHRDGCCGYSMNRLGRDSPMWIHITKTQKHPKLSVRFSFLLAPFFTSVQMFSLLADQKEGTLMSGFRYF